MVKGTTRQVLVVRPQESDLFEQAIFLLREEAREQHGVTEQALLEEARWCDFPPELLTRRLPLLCDPDLEKLRHFLREQYRLTKRRTADRPPSISLRLPRPEHLNFRFARVLVNAFRLHSELLTPVKRKRPLIFLVDTQRQARFARLRIL